MWYNLAMRFGTLQTRSSAVVAIVVCLLLGLFLPAAAAQSSDEILVTVPVFGVGGASRAGDWTGIQVSLADQGSRVREVVVWVETKDPDGDYIRHERVLATAPGEVKTVWLYLKLPPGIRSTGGNLSVMVHEALTDADGKLEIGKRLGQTQATIRGVLSEMFGITAIVGRSHAGLIGYGLNERNSNKTFAIGGNERMALTTGIQIEQLPDRYMGLIPFDVIVWTAGSATPLSVDQAAAIREWVKRGGHFVVVMRSGDIDWITDARFNPLYSVMPAVNIDRVEGVNYEVYRGILAQPQTKAPLPGNQTVHVFTPVDNLAKQTDAIRIINGVDGKCVVVSRLVGTGAVTLVGLNLTSSALLPAGRPHIEAFWNRVLGRRDKMMTKDDLKEASRGRERDTAIYDRQIADRIDATGAATQGVVLGFVVFLAYWLVAAPVSFALLKKADQLRFAWLAFVGATILFTAISWGGVAIIKPKTGHNRHVTFLEHVYGPSVQRSRTFLSVLIPEYGDATISVSDNADEGGERFNNIITPFGGLSASASFPDSRAYYIDAANPSETTFPVRSTIKEFRIDWAGSTDWNMPRPIGGGATYPTRPGEIRVTPQSPPGTGVHVLEGVLEHNLPTSIDNVVVIVTRGQRYYANNQDVLAMPPYEFSLNGAWRPGTPLYLSDLTLIEKAGDAKRLPSWLNRHRNKNWNQPNSTADALIAAGLINMMDRPDPNDNRGMTPLRSVMHGWDLGRWFTQPCVIVLGTLDNAACPTPIRVNGKPIEANGLTVIRWIYPLPENPLQIEPDEDLTSPIDGG
jgi:hypothetical protein